MARHGKQMSYEERMACGEQAAQGKTDGEIARETGWSLWAVRKWRRRYQKQGEIGLAPKMGRPKEGALSSYPSDLRAELERMRKGHPGWGPITLLTELKIDAHCPFAPLPSRARVAAFLKEKELVRAYQPKTGFPEPPRSVSEVHEEWEMDAQGKQQVEKLGQVSVVNIMDVFSHLKVASYPHLLKAGLTWEDYQFILRCSFTVHGMPKRISLDHDSAFYDNTCNTPFPSRLHLWLIGLGIGVDFIRKPPPAEHAHIERDHQTIQAQGITGQAFEDQLQLWKTLDQRRDFLNLFYPSRSLGGQAPLQAFPQARHSQRTYLPQWEADLFDLNRVVLFLAKGRWFRETSKAGEFCLGMHRYNTGRAWAHTTVEITFDPVTRELLAKLVGSENVQRFPILGITPTDLMGDLPPYKRMPAYQLALPFTRETWLKDQSKLLMTGTTF